MTHYDNHLERQMRMEKVQRERITEERVRAMDANEVVDWIHELEDRVKALSEALENIKSDAEYSVEHQLHNRETAYIETCNEVLEQ